MFALLVAGAAGAAPQDPARNAELRSRIATLTSELNELRFLLKSLQEPDAVDEHEPELFDVPGPSAPLATGPTPVKSFDDAHKRRLAVGNGTVAALTLQVCHPVRTRCELFRSA
ncbi:MAG: hypothetical protein P4L40_12595, partial [Terracidiphilus sp.]|nr:hypothetical protein [Terracidiphilus sp.]